MHEETIRTSKGPVDRWEIASNVRRQLCAGRCAALGIHRKPAHILSMLHQHTCVLWPS